MLNITSSGSTANTERFLKRMQRGDPYRRMERYAEMILAALKEATPEDTGFSRDEWYYEITHRNGKYTINWKNSYVVDGVPVVILLQYGHSTGTGGWVEGRDFINPAIRPLFDKISNEIWEEVKRNG